MAIANWTLDGGDGSEDRAAFISSSGDIAVYRGTDPASATTWALEGVYWVGSPIGRRCFCQFAGDVALICQDGLLPLSKALIVARSSNQEALTDKIMNTTSASISLYGGTYGWQVIPFAGENMLIMNVPIGVGSQQQYVMNTITGAWCRFKGWAANCFELFGDTLYYGGNGVVYKAWQGHSDAGNNINGEALQAFNYFGSPDSLKHFTMARPLIAIDSAAGFNFGVNTDFDMATPLSIPTFTQSSAALWGVGKWGQGKWGGMPQIQRNWQTVLGVGYCAGLHIAASTNSGAIDWYATDFVYKHGGIL